MRSDFNDRTYPSGRLDPRVHVSRIPNVIGHRERMSARPAVRRAITEELQTLPTRDDRTAADAARVRYPIVRATSPRLKQVKIAGSRTPCHYSSARWQLVEAGCVFLSLLTSREDDDHGQ